MGQDEPAVASVPDEPAVASVPDDPEVGFRAVGALHRLAEQVEARSVRLARERGWSWEQIGDALGVSRQSVHAKHAVPKK
jgi:DNA-directed RNA polymerase specialized sigma24 family protein